MKRCWTRAKGHGSVALRSLSATLAAAAATSALGASGGVPQVTRTGSHLSVQLDATEAGTWTLEDTEGHVCATGPVGLGANSINLAKLASPTDVRLRISNSHGTQIVSDIPGIVHRSKLQKPDRDAVIYQVPIRTYLATGNGRAQVGTFNALSDATLREIHDLGVDYLWVTGVLEQASRDQTDPDVVKGDGGSYYAIYDSWDVSGQLGTLDDFDALIARAHAAGLRVLIDFVSNHTARMHRTDVACKQHLDFGRNDQTDVSFSPNNNYYYIVDSTFTPPAQGGVGGADGVFDTDIFSPGLQTETPARVTGNDIVAASPGISDWYETAKLNYGWDLVHKQAFYTPTPRTWDQMLDVARYWVDKGVDGFRLDFAHAVPIEFWRHFASELKAVQPDVFLLAEAYESDGRMKLPGFSYSAMLDAGIDSIYNSDAYWAMRNQAARTGDMRAAAPSRFPAFAPAIVDHGYRFTQYMENHDEVRVASRSFAQWTSDREQRAGLGLAYTAFLALMPGNLLLQGGQEVQEDASVFGPYTGDNGRTSIFDFVYQDKTRLWLAGPRPDWMTAFRQRYLALLDLKRRVPFNQEHTSAAPTFVDLDPINGWSDQSRFVGAYVRGSASDAYLVVTNGDPFDAHAATIHLTSQDNGDSHGALHALGIVNDGTRYAFTEVFSRAGWVPTDPAVSGAGTPGWALYKSGNVPSGLFLGDVPPATTYVFRVSKL